MNKNKLLEIARSNEQHISDLLPYIDLLQKSQDVRVKNTISYLKRFANRSKEYHSSSFVVLVVGPVKSGKSTFVNLVSGEYVSPTHFLECTGRPSIIYKNESKDITVYRSKNTLEKNGQIEDVFDALNGIINKTEIPDIETKTIEFSKDNIEKYVKLDVNNVSNDDTLITSIAIESGGNLLQDNVLIIDMAGFDGAKANMSNTPYEKIVERADLVVFVQSSNSVISKVSSEFFSIIKKHNKKAPICLIHNIFDSAFWRPKELKIKDSDEHIKYAVNEFKNTHGLFIDEKNAFNINLGKVSDLRNNSFEGPYKDILKEAESEFLDAEKEISNLLLNRESIRLNNCISRTYNKQQELLAYLDSVIYYYADKLYKYEQEESRFEKSKIDCDSLEWNTDSIFDINSIRDIVSQNYRRAEEMASVRPKYKTIDARNIAVRFITDVEYDLKKYFEGQYTILHNIQSTQVVRDAISKIKLYVEDLKNMNIEYKTKDEYAVNIKIQDFTFEPNIDLETLIPRLKLANKHTDEQLKRVLRLIYEEFVGFTDTGNYNVRGYIEKVLFPEMHRKIKMAKNEYIKDLVSAINNDISKLQDITLKTIIPDIKACQKDLEILNKLRLNVNHLEIKNYE